MEKRKFYTQEEVLDRAYGKVGTPERDEYEAGLKAFLEKERVRRENRNRRKIQAQSVETAKKSAIV